MGFSPSSHGECSSHWEASNSLPIFQTLRAWTPRRRSGACSESGSEPELAALLCHGGPIFPCRQTDDGLEWSRIAHPAVGLWHQRTSTPSACPVFHLGCARREGNA